MKDYQLYITGNMVKFYIIANEQCSKHFNTPCHSIHCACWLRSGFLSWSWMMTIPQYIYILYIYIYWHGALPRFLWCYFVQVWLIIDPKFGNYCPQLLGIFVPNFWEFLSPTFGELLSPTLGIFCPQLLGKSWGQKFPRVGDTNSPKVGDNNSIPMGKIIVLNFSQPKKLGTIIIPIGIELLSPTVWEFLSPTFGDKNSQIHKRWGQKSPKVGDKNSQFRKSWGQQFPKVGGKNSQKLGTKIPKSWGQKFQNSEKLGTKKPKS